MSDSSRRTILQRRAQLIAAALATAGMSSGCKVQRPPAEVQSGDPVAIQVAPVEPVVDEDARALVPNAEPRPPEPEPRVDGDADSDGVLDGDDACPQRGGYKIDARGCPIPCLSIVAPSRPLVRELIMFASGQSTLQPLSVARLDKVVLALKRHPKLVVEVVGHCDNTETPSVAARRAKVVHQYLVKRGIDPARLTVSSKGPAQPLMYNTTPTGREANRRVQFHVRVGP